MPPIKFVINQIMPLIDRHASWLECVLRMTELHYMSLLFKDLARSGLQGLASKLVLPIVIVLDLFITSRVQVHGALQASA